MSSSAAAAQAQLHRESPFMSWHCHAVGTACLGRNCMPSVKVHMTRRCLARSTRNAPSIRVESKPQPLNPKTVLRNRKPTLIWSTVKLLRQLL